jgi:hypothetical protein
MNSPNQNSGSYEYHPPFDYTSPIPEELQTADYRLRLPEDKGLDPRNEADMELYAWAGGDDILIDFGKAQRHLQEERYRRNNISEESFVRANHFLNEAIKRRIREIQQGGEGPDFLSSPDRGET